jgi:uncharacterized membrane protein
MDTRRVKQYVEEGLERIPSPEQNVGEQERWVSLGGGVALALAGLRRGGLSGMVLGALGGMLMYRGASGHCSVYDRMGYDTSTGQRASLLTQRELHVSTSVIVDRPRDELYRFWRNFENLPRFMQHILEVTKHDDRRSHWVARSPLGMRVEWDSEVTEDVPNERIRWRATEDSEVQHHGEVRFREATGGRGTEIDVDMSYRPPGGALGATVGRFLNGLTRYEMQADVRRFKQLMEAGEIPTGQRAPGSSQSP